MKNRVLLWLFGVIILHPVFPQSTIPDLTKSTEPPGTELLRNGLITDIAEDPHGFIWIASDQGMFRYDGTELFKVFSECFLDIKYSPHSQTFAFTHTKGIYLYSVPNDNSQSFLTRDTGHREMNTFCSAFVSDTVLIIGQRDGFTIQNLKSGASEFHMLDNMGNVGVSVLQIAVDHRDSNWLWVATSIGLCHYNLKDKCQDYYFFEANKPEFTSSYNYSWEVVQHADGRISLSSDYTGAILFDPSDGSYRQIYIEKRDATTQRLPDDRIYAILEDPDGNVWYSSTAGVMLYDLRRDTVLYHLSRPVSDMEYHLGPHLIDSRGWLWGGYRSGLKLIDPSWSRVKTFTCPGNKTDIGYEFWDAEQRGAILYYCLRLSDGLYIYDLGTDNLKVIKPALSDESITIDPVDILIKGDTVLLLESSRLYIYQPGDTTLSIVPLGYDSLEYRFRSICHVSGNKYWIMTEFKGVFIADLEAHSLNKYRVLHARFPDLVKSEGRMLYKDALGYLWVVTKDNILRGKPGVMDFVDLKDQFNKGKSLEINSIFEEHGKMWLATYNGVHLIDPLSSNKVLVSTPYKGEACRITRVDSNSLWIITKKSVIDFNLKTGNSQVYTSGFGLTKSLFRGYSLIHKIGKDTLIIGDAFGKFAVFRPGDFVKPTTTDMPYLVSFEANGSEPDMDSSLYLTNRISLGPNENNLNIRFSSLGFQHSPQQKYRFKLDGVDKEWQTAITGEQSVRYSNLGGGKYPFLLQTEDNQGNLSAIRTYDIFIATTFYEKTSVQIAGIIIILGLFYMIYRNKVHRIEERSRMQEQLLEMERKALRAQMNPHFVFNALNAIQYLITNGDELKAIKFLNKFSKLLRSVLDSSADKKVLLEHEIVMLENYIELEALRLENKFTFQIKLDDSLKNEKVRIPSMLLQPFVENAINHGLQHKNGIGHLQLEFLDKENYLICRVEDDGIGREASAALKARYRKSHISRGISISEARLRYYGKGTNGNNLDQLMITDLKDQNNCAIGTRVEIKVPLEAS